MIHRSKLILGVALSATVLAACGGSSTSAPDSPTTLFQKNGSLISNLKHYSGIGSSNEYESDVSKDYSKAEFRNGDKFAYDFDIDLSAVDANELAPSSKLVTYTYRCMVNGVEKEDGCSSSYTTFSLEVDFRNVFSNFRLKSLDGNAGKVDLSKIKWAKCPLRAEMGYEYPGQGVTAPTYNAGSLFVTFAEAPNDAVAGDKCNPVPETGKKTVSSSSIPQNFYTASGEAVEATGAKFTMSFSRQWINGRNLLVQLPRAPRPVFKDVFPTGFDGFGEDATLYKNLNFQGTETITYSWVNNGKTYSNTYRVSHSMNLKSLSSKVVKDFSPYALVATADAAGVTAQWSRSADLGPDDAVTHVVEMSKDNFTTVSETKLISQDANLSTLLPSCDLDPKNTLKVGTQLSLRVKTLDSDGAPSAYSDTAVVEKALNNLICPTATLAAPTALKVELSVAAKQYSVQWNAITDAGDTELTYCIESSKSSFALKTEDNKYCLGNTTQGSIEWTGQDFLAFRVVAVSANGVVSQPSEVAVVQFPDPQPVTELVAGQVEDGLKLSWSPAKQSGGLSNVSHFVKWGLLVGEKRNPELASYSMGDIAAYMLARNDFVKYVLPGSKIWVDVSSCTEVGCSKPESIVYAFPEKEVTALPEDIAVNSTLPEVAASGSVVSTTTTKPEATATSSTVISTANAFAGCYIRGNVRSCGNYVLQFVK